jgi:tRNA (guanine37-N1)-methyltransferase
MRVDIVTLFPNMFEGPFSESIVKRAQEKGLFELNIHDLRKYGLGERRTVDDRPYSGGAGMIIMVEPVFKILEEIKTPNCKVIITTPRGQKYTQAKAQEYSKLDHLIILAGHFEGFDERIHDNLVDEEISIGDYVLTGGELPAMVIADSIARLIPGVLKKEEATVNESFSEGLLEYPQYTRPEEYNGWKVPEILLGGNHGEIEKWKKEKSEEKTKKVRPDLIAQR